MGNMSVGGSGLIIGTGEYIRNYETTTPITADLSPADMGRLEDEKNSQSRRTKSKKNGTIRERTQKNND